MNIFLELKQSIANAYFSIFAEKITLNQIIIETPKDNKNGDLSTNIAMIIANKKKIPPKELAEKFQTILATENYIQSIEIAGHGFINFFIKNEKWQSYLHDIINNHNFFDKLDLGENQKLNIEYVSANPTGPMHVGHIRGAVFGEVLANVLKKCGYDVTKEYYINDAGVQINILAESVFLRYKEIITKAKQEIPSGLYSGEYLINVANSLIEIYENKLLLIDTEERTQIIKKFAIEQMMLLIKDDLAALNIKHDIFTSELNLLQQGKIQHIVDKLINSNKIYYGTLPPPKENQTEEWESSKQLLFKSTEFGDDQDRTVQKSDGSWTYFAGDLALAADKISRGFSQLIYILGADHIGYIKRINAMANAISEGKVKSIVKTCQLVKLMENGLPVKMSKRSGNFISASDIIKEVGKDNILFMMLTRHQDMELEFDFEKVKEQSKDNPVYYVQYAHVRTVSILNNAKQAMPHAYQNFVAKKYNLSLLNNQEELSLIKTLVSWSKMLESTALNLEPHRLANYLLEVATKFHSLWNLNKEGNFYRFIIEENDNITIARLALVKSVQTILANGFELIGITPMEKI